MKDRDSASFLRGMGSVLDLGGTTYRRAPLKSVRKGSPAADQRALAKDVKVAVRSISSGTRRRIDD